MVDRLPPHAAWICAILCLASCGAERSPLDEIDLDGEPDIVIEDFVYSSTVSNRKIWEISAAEAEKYEDSRKFLFKTVLLKLYEGRNVNTVLTSKYGVINFGGKDVTAYSNVVLITSERTKLFTESLTWDNARGILKTEAFVRIVKPNGDVLTGYGLEMDKAAEMITIKQRVKGTVNKKDDSQKGLF